VAPPAVIPTPLPKWAKFAISLGATPNSYLVQILDYLGTMNPSSDPNPGEWRHIQVVYENLITGLAADRCVISFDIANITNGGLDSSWTDTDRTTVASHLQTLLGQWGAYQSAALKATEMRFYRRAFNPYTSEKPFAPGGPPEQVFPMGFVGQGTSVIPHQVALTHTEITAYPRHWGRVYWPGATYGPTLMYQDGIAVPAHVDAFAAAVHDTYDALMQAQFFPVVPTTMALKVPSRNLLGIQKIQVDDIYDVVRRRRRRNAAYKTSLPL